MTTLDEIFLYAPGIQEQPVANTVSSSLFPEPVAAWRAIQDIPNYNYPVDPAGTEGFGPLLRLTEEAKRTAASWETDTEAQAQEQQENVAMFEAAQLTVIMEDRD